MEDDEEYIKTSCHLLQIAIFTMQTKAHLFINSVDYRKQNSDFTTFEKGNKLLCVKQFYVFFFSSQQTVTNTVKCMNSKLVKMSHGM